MPNPVTHAAVRQRCLHVLLLILPRPHLTCSHAFFFALPRNCPIQGMSSNVMLLATSTTLLSTFLRVRRFLATVIGFALKLNIYLTRTIGLVGTAGDNMNRENQSTEIPLPENSTSTSTIKKPRRDLHLDSVDASRSPTVENSPTRYKQCRTRWSNRMKIVT